MTVVAAELDPGAFSRPLVVALTPTEFTDWAQGKLTHVNHGTHGRVKLPPPWQPGQHFGLIGKTREGKTNFCVWLLSIVRKFVMALDPKGEDESLSASGWIRVSTVPGGQARAKLGSQEWRRWRDIDRARADGRPVRVVAGIATRTREADAANKQLMRDTIEYVRQAGGYTLYVDEHQILSDPRLYRLGEDIARQAISAARDGVSVVGSMQYLAWVEKTLTRQSTLIALWKTRDVDLIKTAARVVGRPWQEIMAAIDELPKWWVLVISDDLRAPILMVRPPKVT